MKNIAQRIRIDYRLVLGLFILLAVFASVQAILKANYDLAGTGRLYTHYNNFIIFKQSYFHLLEGKDLYKWYLDKQWDLYKYSPTFSLFFVFFSYLPDLPGLILWNLVNTLALFFGIAYLPVLKPRTKAVMLLALGIELLTSLQSEQSNALMAGLIILSFGLLEREKYLWATLCIVFSIYIKLFGVLAFALFLFYPRKWKLALYTAMWFIVLFLLPSVVISFAQLLFLYKSWLDMLAHDHSASLGFSVMGWLHTWFNLTPSKISILLAGALVFCIPFIRVRQYSDYYFRLLTLASILVWVIIFNHKAESPTFVIALAGVVIWYFSQESKPVNLALFILAVFFTQLAPTDLYPRFIRKEYFEPLVVKVVPCILIWVKIIYELISLNYRPRLGTTLSE